MEKEKSALKIKAQIMLEELKCKYQKFNDVKNDKNIIEKIIELNFDEDKIKKFYYGVDKLFNRIEDDYGITGFIDEDVVKNKIMELNCDKEKIIDWIENLLAG